MNLRKNLDTTDMVVDVAADNLDSDGIKQWLLKHKKMET